MKEERFVAYLDQIRGDARLDGGRVLVAPSVPESRLAKFANPITLKSNEVGNVRLLQDREARASHGGGNKPLEEAGRQADRVDSAIDFFLQNVDELIRGVENPVPLAHRDVFGLVPWELLQGADEALKWTLRTAAGERALSRPR